LSNGDYNVKLEFSPSLDKIHSFKELSNSFNKLSDELKNTEMLRSDFINNFSHEFKTPIVSILGFARLLKKENLTEDERAQYVNAIEKESLRLSSMATNVLNLTKVENQTILANISRFNLSEQIRASLLLLESKWSKKDPELNIDFGEYEIEANEELLEQVWINLLDNAIKFTQNHGVISLNIVENADYILVSVGNTGTDIPPDSLDKIWRKFYQADESHASDGNGIGLAIVKRIVDLHNGDVTVKSQDGFTEFTVILPKNQ
jgi:signal transduction histidine kinase